jgi:cell division protein FtsQ
MMTGRARVEGHFIIKAAAWLVALAVIALPVVAVVNGWVGGGHWPFRQLRVDADFDKVNVEAVQNAAAPALAAGFFAVDLGLVRDAVEQLPWVESAEARKLWPDTVEIRIATYTAAARWNDEQLIDERGRMFSVPPSERPENLVRLFGPDDRADEVLALERDLASRLTGAGLELAGLRLSDRGSLDVALADGRLIRLGRERTTERLSRFLGALPDAQPPRPGMQWTRADLRYSNGFAMAWVVRPDAPADDATTTPPADEVGEASPPTTGVDA